ncbi:hypothetical protein [Bradyrhizobium sp. sBnM-33]|uniref:hypothetical protein n=1 Tax=Bradyrhizobium sp. sBnM-33 TaxID=2831780 RepID=UPI001BD05428|nr:hypothetical protein [Bradyrhizobium sp. sBnM-33]WOH52296.1 hypothetical protein RX328_08765 [Bradyrhizobium sp. sBnM-33]
MRCGSCAAMSLTCVTVGSLDEPRCRNLFASDIERQRITLMDMIAALVGSRDERPLLRSVPTNSAVL